LKRKIVAPIRFLFLYAWAWLVHLLHLGAMPAVPKGSLYGIGLFTFYDPQGENPNKPHGVVAFLLEPGDSADNYTKHLLGPLGPADQIDFRDLHLYGRDTWGTVEAYQLADKRNAALAALAKEHPDCKILLAGVRMFFGRHIWPLNDPTKFILIRNPKE